MVRILDQDKKNIVGLIVALFIICIAGALLSYFAKDNKDETVPVNAVSVNKDKTIPVNKNLKRLPIPHFPDMENLPNFGKIDYNWEFFTLSGKSVKTTDFKGKVIFINFWATWCRPCVIEMPGLQILYDKLKKENVEFLFISNEEKNRVKNFIEQNNYTMPIYIKGEKIPKAIEYRGIPSIFIVNKDGTIVFKHTGSANWSDKSCVDFIKKLL